MERKLLGVLTPSSNTILEPVTSAMLAGIPQASAHFSRFTVKRIALSSDADAQFEHAPMLDAASLLADARVGVIAWSGTSASWLGFERDEMLCDKIAQRTGIPASTAVLALNELIAAGGHDRIGLVSPYTPDVQAAIIAQYQRHGIAVSGEAHASLSDNYAFSEVDDATVLAMCRQVAATRPQSIVIMCTNMRGAHLMDAFERETGIPLYDSTAAVVWKALAVLGVERTACRGWGSMFAR